MTVSPAAVELQEPLLIGRGTHRLCYRHPRDNSRCIKVLSRRPPRRDQLRAVQRELDMYRRLQQRQIDWSMLARYHGPVETTRGEGQVYELIRDVDGQVARTLEDWLRDTPEALDKAALLTALRQLRRYLMHYRVITTTLHAHNMVWQRREDAPPRLVVIDDIGNADFIPVRQILPFMAHNKIRRKWQRFERRLRDEFSVDVKIRG